MATSAAKIFVEFGSKGADQVAADARNLSKELQGAAKGGGLLKTALGTGAGFLGAQLFSNAVGQVTNFAGGLINAHAQAETLGKMLETAVGDRADAVYASLQQFAKQTPFEFPELVSATAMIENFGIVSDKVIGDTGRNWVQVMGDTASATGKTYDQVANAVTDAATGSFERLSELGVKATVEGDKVKFRYMQNGKEMVAEADRNSSDMVLSTLAGIWNSKYEGAMEKQASSWAGLRATLSDNWNMTMQRMTGGVFDFAKDGLKHANMFFDRFNVGLDRGLSPFQALVRAMRFSLQDAFGKDTGNQIFAVLNGIGTGLKTAAGWAQQFATSVTAGRFLNAFGKIGRSVLDIGRAFQRGGFTEAWDAIIGRPGQRLLQGFGDLFSARFKMVGDALARVTTGLKPLDRLIGQTGRQFTDMGRLIQEVFQGDFGGALEVGERFLRRFGDMGRTAIDGIREGISAINWSAVADGIGDFASGAWSAIQTGLQLAWNEITALDWDRYIDKIEDFAGLVASKIEDLPWGNYLDKVTDFAGMVAEKISELPWGDYLDKVGDLAALIGGKIRDLPWSQFLSRVGDLASLIGGKIRDLPWSQFLNRVGDLGALIAGKIKDLPWGDYLSKVQNLAGVIASKIVSLPWGDYLDKVQDFAGVIAGKISLLPWGDFIGKVEDFSGLVAEKIGEVDWAALIGTIADFSVWLWEKIKGNFPDRLVISGTITNVGTWVWGKIKEWFPSSATITGSIADVAEWAWGKISAHFPSSAVITGSIGDFGEWLWGKIKDKFPDVPLVGGGSAPGTSSNPDAIQTPIGSAGRRNIMYDPAFLNPITGQQYVEHSPGPGYALEQGPPVTYEPSRLGFTYTIDADTTPAENKLKGLFGGGSGGETGKTYTSKLDLDTGPAAEKYTQASTFAEAWAARTFTGILDLNIGPAAAQYTNASTFAEAWGAAVFTSTFDADNGPAAVAYTDAFSWGDTWAGTTFTARFSVDLSPLENALVRTRQIAQEISDLLPSSPAKKGPLARRISFGYIGDALLDTMRGMVRDTQAGMAAVSGALAGPDPAIERRPVAGAPRRDAPIIVVNAVKSDELVELIEGSRIGLRLGRNLSTQLQLLAQGSIA